LTTDSKKNPDKHGEMDAGKEAVLAAYSDLMEAQAHFRKAAEAAGMDLKNDAVDQLLKGRDKADALGRDVQRYVHEKPATSLGLAFLAGMLISRLLSRD